MFKAILSKKGVSIELVGRTMEELDQKIEFFLVDNVDLWSIEIVK